MMFGLDRLLNNQNKPIKNAVTPEVMHKERNADMIHDKVQEAVKDVRSKLTHLEETIDELLTLHDARKDR